MRSQSISVARRTATDDGDSGCWSILCIRLLTSAATGWGLFPLAIAQALGYDAAMAEIVEFVNRGAASVTPAVVDKMLRHLPQWKLEFTQIYEPLFPHLVDQLEFLANAIEDTAEGAYKDLPYMAFAQAVFALIYSHKKVGIIPDTVLNLGRADDS